MTTTNSPALAFLACIIFFAATTGANAQSIDWLHLTGGTQGENIEDVITDAAGNSYVTGKFAGTSVIGDSTFTAVGGADAFTAKYDPSGNFIWAVQEGGLAEDVGVEIGLDAAGNCYVAGRYIDTITIGDTVFGSEGRVDIFVVKYDINANVVWAKTFGGNRDDRCRGLYTDSAGFTYISGRYRILGLFDTIFLPAVGIEDVFVAKLDLNGDVIWAKSFGGPKLDFGEALTVDKDGNIIITGSYFQNMTLQDTTLIALGDEETFVAKLDNDGNLLWARSEGGPLRDYGEDVNTDEFGNILVGGATTGPFLFGEDTVEGYGLLDIFLFKYKPDGTRMWSLVGGSVTGNDAVWGSGYDGRGNTFLTGWFRGNLNFGPFFIPGSPTYNLMCIKVDAAGKPTWVTKLGDYFSDDIGRGLSTDAAGNPYIGGAFQDTSTYMGTQYVPVGKSDILLTKLTKGFDNCAVAEVEYSAPSACNPANGFYSIDVTVTHYFAPDSGSLRINDQFFPIGTSPQTVTMDSMIADGLPVDLAVQFTENTLCNEIIMDAFTAPEPCGLCMIDTIYIDSVKACKPISNRYQARVAIEFTQDPDTGFLSVNGQLFNIGNSPNIITLDGLYSDSLPVDITAFFTEDTTCSYFAPALFNAPPACGECVINNIVLDSVSPCDPLTNTYSVTLGLNIRAWPASGGLNVQGQIFPITGTPMWVTLTGLTPDGLSHDISANFEGDPTCSLTEFDLYTAPMPCDTCVIVDINVLDVGSCDPFSLNYNVDLEVLYGTPPDSGSLEINGQLFAITGSPQVVTLTGLPADSLDVDVTAHFTEMPACDYFQTALFTAPASCLACNIMAIELDTIINNCTPAAPTYDAAVTITYLYPPLTGDLVVEGQVFAIASSPQSVNLVGLTPTGNPQDITASFSDDPGCTYTATGLYVSPAACDTCQVPVNLVATLDSLSPQSVLVEWDEVTDAVAYLVKGRKAASSASGVVNAFSNGKVVNGLKTNQSYAWTVRSYCPYDTSEYAPESFFTTYDLRLAEFSGQLADRLTLYPNPTSDRAELVLESEFEGTVQIQLSSSTGQVIDVIQKQMFEGNNRVSLDLTGLPQGMYVINVNTATEQGFLRLVLTR